MKYRWYIIFIITLFLAGCITVLELRFDPDPRLESNANVYRVKWPTDWMPMKLNVFFGKYRVEGADKGSAVLTNPSKIELPILLQILGMSIPEPSERTLAMSHEYMFFAADRAWRSECTLLANVRVTKEEKATVTEHLSSNYSCRFRQGSDKQWTLSIKRDGYRISDITMSRDGQSFSATPKRGRYYTSDGKPHKLSAPSDSGYLWTQDSRSVAAISSREKTPRVWLVRQNTEQENDALAMANAGLLIYFWKAAPALRECCQ